MTILSQQGSSRIIPEAWGPVLLCESVFQSRSHFDYIKFDLLHSHHFMSSFNHPIARSAKSATHYTEDLTRRVLTRTNPIRSLPSAPRALPSFPPTFCDLALTAYGLSVLGDDVRQSSTKGQTGLRTIALAVLFQVSSVNNGARIS